ncbi:UPF0651 protein YPL107W, mitochondrial [Ceratocystis fimbriata CBS 114723]|uniref:UPF0651 protein YPL107W, mitochondrial n=1 Tax=Ceratocystis fimbriata CBS 114723 TaxID=1035309 RepID=A0A2C5X3N4_9PEZI|nr:UPF0651 protein YPL107W, mitochondrial [Ceratocystis fimbriata CBS 114723]
MSIVRPSRACLPELWKATSLAGVLVCKKFSTTQCIAQVHPRGSYYDAVMRSPRSPSHPMAPPIFKSTTATEEISITDKELGPEARAKLVFGSPLTGPERLANLQSQGTVVNGIKIPKKPEEPDNCCMSGCVHCVWDMYQEEIYQWQAAMKEAEAAAPAESQPETLSPGNRSSPVIEQAKDLTKQPPEAKAKAKKETRELTDAEKKQEYDSLFGGVPVGIRQFMLTEKKIRSNQKDSSATNGA